MLVLVLVLSDSTRTRYQSQAKQITGVALHLSSLGITDYCSFHLSVALEDGTLVNFFW